MPYADPEKRRAADREYYHKKRKGSKDFKKQEAERKRKWYLENRAKPKKKQKAPSYVEKYQTSRKFREKEAERKQSWYEANREKVIARVLARREALREAKKSRREAA